MWIIYGFRSAVIGSGFSGTPGSIIAVNEISVNLGYVITAMLIMTCAVDQKDVIRHK